MAMVMFGFHLIVRSSEEIETKVCLCVCARAREEFRCEGLCGLPCSAIYISAHEMTGDTQIVNIDKVRSA